MYRGLICKGSKWVGILIYGVSGFIGHIASDWEYIAEKYKACSNIGYYADDSELFVPAFKNGNAFDRNGCRTSGD